MKIKGNSTTKRVDKTLNSHQRIHSSHPNSRIERKNISRMKKSEWMFDNFYTNVNNSKLNASMYNSGKHHIRKHNWMSTIEKRFKLNTASVKFHRK